MGRPVFRICSGWDTRLISMAGRKTRHPQRKPRAQSPPSREGENIQTGGNKVGVRSGGQKSTNTRAARRFGGMRSDARWGRAEQRIKEVVIMAQSTKGSGTRTKGKGGGTSRQRARGGSQRGAGASKSSSTKAAGNRSRQGSGASGGGSGRQSSRAVSKTPTRTGPRKASRHAPAKAAQARSTGLARRRESAGRAGSQS